MEAIRWVANTMPSSDDRYLPTMTAEVVEGVRAYHRSFPQYAETPLALLDAQARRLGLARVAVKDESFRFGLNAFKVLGGSYAIGSYIADRLGKPRSEVTYGYLTSDEFAREFGQATFFTATDGNHGRGVAWSARQLGQRAVVHMPKGTVRSRYENIAKEGAQVTVEDVNYDACVRMAAAEAAGCENGIVVQDTSWEGYEQVPTWIMQGYGTMASEAAEQLERQSAGRPTHVFVQAGVGSLAGGVVAYFANRYPDDPPTFVVVEASEGACLYKSARAGDGEPRSVEGDMPTMMAGLACGVPNPISWDILRNHATAFVSCPDWVAAKGMRMLAAPMGDDPRVVSGESGAVGMGLLAAVMEDERYRGLRELLGLDEKSNVLLFSTEGATDPENYRKVVWDGAQPSVG